MLWLPINTVFAPKNAWMFQVPTPRFDGATVNVACDVAFPAGESVAPTLNDGALNVTTP